MNEDVVGALVGDLEQVIGEAEDRLLEIENTQPICRSLDLRGVLLVFEVEPAVLGMCAERRDAERLCEATAIAVLRKNALIPAVHHVAGKRLCELEHGLFDAELSAVESVVLSMATETFDVANRRGDMHREALAAAEAALTNLSNRRLTEALKQAERAERLESELDPMRSFYFEANGGCADDEIGQSLLYVRNSIRDFCALIPNESVLIALERYPMVKSAAERQVLLGTLLTAPGRGALLVMASSGELPASLRLAAAMSLVRAGDLAFDQVVGLAVGIGTLSGELPDPLIRKLVSSIRAYGKVGASNRSAAGQALERLLLLRVSSRARQSVFRALREVADVATIERVLALPGLSTADFVSVGELVARVMRRPIDVKSLRAGTFERLVHWLVQREHAELDLESARSEVSGFVDITGRRRRRFAVFAAGSVALNVRCSTRRSASEGDISSLLSQTTRDGNEAWFVTRGSCSKALHNFATDAGIRLVDRRALRGLLDRHAPGRYAL